MTRAESRNHKSHIISESHEHGIILETREMAQELARKIGDIE